MRLLGVRHGLLSATSDVDASECATSAYRAEDDRGRGFASEPARAQEVTTSLVRQAAGSQCPEGVGELGRRAPDTGRVGLTIFVITFGGAAARPDDHRHRGRRRAGPPVAD